MKYLIWSMRKNAWYGADCSGYAADVASAGRYERAAVGDVVTGALPGQLVPVDEALAQNVLSELRGADVAAHIDSFRGY